MYAIPGPPVFNVSGSSGGGSGDASRLELNFAYGDASPELIGQVPAGREIFKCTIYLTTAFNGTSPALSVGTSGTPADLMATTDVLPGEVAEYSVYPRKSYGSNTDLYLHITPGSGASAGAGIVVIEFEPS